jgi:hypothetical protein
MQRMAPSLIRQDLLAQFSEAFFDLTVVVAGLKFVVDIFEHVGGVASKMIDPKIFLIAADSKDSWILSKKRFEYVKFLVPFSSKLYPCNQSTAVACIR